MVKIKLNSLLKMLVTLLLSIIIIGCDGGIFGTGDGGELGSVIADSEVPGVDSPLPTVDPENSNDADAPDDQQPPAVVTPPAATPSEETPTEELDSVIEFAPQTDLTVSSGPTASFMNPFLVTADSSTELQFVNLTGLTVGVFSSADPSASAIAFTPLATTIANGDVAVNTSTLFIDLVNTAGARTNLTTVNPVELTTGSRTLIILRRVVPTVDIIILPFTTGTLDPGEAAVRIVSAALIGDPLTPSTFTLQQTPSLGFISGTPITVQFDPVTFSSPVTEYMIVSENIVTLNDTAARYIDLLIDFNDLGGEVVTVVLDPSLPNQHLVLIDNP